MKLELSNIFQQSTFAERNQKPSHLEPSLHGDAREDKVLIIDNVQVGPVMLCSPGGTVELNHMFDQWCFVQMFLHNIFLDHAASYQVSEFEIYTTLSLTPGQISCSRNVARKTSCCSHTTASSFYLGAQTCGEGFGQQPSGRNRWTFPTNLWPSRLNQMAVVLAGTTTPMTRHCSRWGHSKVGSFWGVWWV